MRQSQTAQSVIYSSDTLVTQVLTPAALPLGSQLTFSPLQNTSGQDIILAVCVFHVCVLPKNNLQLPFGKTVLNLLWYFILSFVHFVALLFTPTFVM